MVVHRYLDPFPHMSILSGLLNLSYSLNGFRTHIMPLLPYISIITIIVLYWVTLSLFRNKYTCVDVIKTLTFVIIHDTNIQHRLRSVKEKKLALKSFAVMPNFRRLSLYPSHLFVCSHKVTVPYGNRAFYPYFETKFSCDSAHRRTANTQNRQIDLHWQDR